MDRLKSRPKLSLALGENYYNGRGDEIEIVLHEKPPTKISKNLYIGNCRDGLDFIQDNPEDFDYSVRISSSPKRTSKHKESHRDLFLPLHCDEEQTERFFVDIVLEVRKLILSGHKVLVYSQRGCTRCCAVAILYMMMFEDMGYKEALSILVRDRGDIDIPLSWSFLFGSV